MALSTIAKNLLIKSVQTMDTEDLQGEIEILEEELSEGQEVVDCRLRVALDRRADPA